LDVFVQRPSAGWIARAPIPYTANHMSFVTAKDGEGNERHFFSGGQDKENEPGDNKVDHFEYIPSNNKWTRRKDLPFPCGHTSSSTRPFGCGYLVIGGTEVDWNRRSDVTFYNIATDTWTKLGDLPHKLNTPICDINHNTNTLYCENGLLTENFSYKRQINL
jgi:Galactose oxidase, central domain